MSDFKKEISNYVNTYVDSKENELECSLALVVTKKGFEKLANFFAKDVVSEKNRITDTADKIYVTEKDNIVLYKKEKGYSSSIQSVTFTTLGAIFNDNLDQYMYLQQYGDGTTIMKGNLKDPDIYVQNTIVLAASAKELTNNELSETMPIPVETYLDMDTDDGENITLKDTNGTSGDLWMYTLDNDGEETSFSIPFKKVLKIRDAINKYISKIEKKRGL